MGNNDEVMLLLMDEEDGDEAQIIAELLDELVEEAMCTYITMQQEMLQQVMSHWLPRPVRDLIVLTAYGEVLLFRRQLEAHRRQLEFELNNL